MKKIWLYARLALLVAALAWAALLYLRPSQHPETARFTQRHDGLPLAASWMSYASIVEIGRGLDLQHFVPERRTLARPPDRRYPPHALDTLTVEHYPLLGTQGQLSLQFLNDRLFEVGFRPDDAALAAATLQRQNPQLQRDANGRAERTEGELRLATNLELAVSSVGSTLDTEPYVLWQDLSLIRERDEWDQRFGALPYKMSPSPGQ